MSRSDSIIQWLAALIVSSAAVAAYIFILEIVTAREASMIMDQILAGPHANNYIPSPMENSGWSLAYKIALSFAAFVVIFTPLIATIALVPALVVSGGWELSGKYPSTPLYAMGGLVAGFAFSVLTLPLWGQKIIDLRDLEFNALRLVILGGSAGFLGGFVMAWRRRAFFRLFLQRPAN